MVSIFSGVETRAQPRQGLVRAYDACHLGGGAVMLDADLLSFIRSAIGSTWTLELLVRVRKDSAKTFTQGELVRDLRSTPALIGRGVRELRAAQLVECVNGDRCRYQPATPELDRMCERLAQSYAERPVAVIHAIAQSPAERRQSFAEAFRFTKKED